MAISATNQLSTHPYIVCNKLFEHTVELLKKKICSRDRIQSVDLLKIKSCVLIPQYSHKFSFKQN